MSQGWPHDLERIQRWMQNVITDPDGVIAGIDREESRLLIDVSVDRVDQVIQRSRNQTSIERLGIYGNAYLARLLGCLRDEFPAMAFALGAETFDAFCFGYLQAYPSHSYTLAELGGQFPKYLADTRPSGVADDQGYPGWPDFLIDLATLERVYSEVFDGPGIENRPSLDADALSQIKPEQWPDARLIPAPCLRLLTLRFPVHEYITAVRGETETEFPQPSATNLAVTRRDFVVRRRALSGDEFDLLRELVGGAPVGRAIERAASAPGVQADRLAVGLRDWFRSWAASGYFLAVEC